MRTEFSLISYLGRNLGWLVLVASAAHAQQAVNNRAALPSVVTLQKKGDRQLFVDNKGMTVYTFDRDTQPGKSVCTKQCATAWPPLMAAADAAAVGDWSVLSREDGTKQWAYRNKPLYTFASDVKAGDANGDGAGGAWHIAVLATAAAAVVVDFPAGITVQKTVLGKVFADSGNKTLYVYDRDVPGKLACVGACTDLWMPLAAPLLARPIAQWTVTRRDDGSKQWAYKGKPLYTYKADFKPAQTNGDGVDARWHAVIQATSFRPTEVKLRTSGEGFMLVDRRGMTLYGLERSGLGGVRNAASQPAASVCTAECTHTWIPIKAPVNAQGSDGWSTVKRDDGSMQWVYEGKALYTYAKDLKAGDINGDITDLFADGRAYSWRVVRP